MPANPIDPISSLAQVLGENSVGMPSRTMGKPLTGNIFEDILGKAVESLEGVSAVESKTNALIEGYLNGKVDLTDVVTATSELNVIIQLATTVANQAVTSFKEITSIPI
jgi:flagellar hook-basal body complex protein FliE